VVRTVARQVIIVVVMAAAAFAFLATFATRHGFFDLRVYYGATNYWAHGHGEIYDYLKPLSKYGYTYPPFAALTMVPMAVLPWMAAIVISVIATVLVTLLIIYWFLRPVIARYHWTPWFTVAVAAVLASVFEPLRETVNFGQVNMLLVFLVVADLILLVDRRPKGPDGGADRSTPGRWDRLGRHWGGIGIGLATAIKLTPGVFIVYLLLARKYRAALVSIATTAAATLAAAVAAPHASLIFWTDAVFDTDRVGSLSYISNQSLEGAVDRLNPTNPSTALWVVLVLATLAVWVWQIRRVVRLRDDLAGLALTGVLGCLVSPVTWVHHLVWLLPAMLLLTSRALLATGRRRIRLLLFVAGFYVLLSSKLVWVWDNHFVGWGKLGSSAYVLASIVLLVCLPLSDGAGRPGPALARSSAGRSGSDSGAHDGGPDSGGSDPGAPDPDRPELDGSGAPRPGSRRPQSAGVGGVSDLGQFDDATVSAPHRVGGAGAVGPEPEARVEPAGGVVRLQHP
jgi:alpha-1,2-mannosyltransferase